jgi:hypothetical protein
VSILPRVNISHYRIFEGTTACSTSDRSLLAPHTSQVHVSSWTHNEILWLCPSEFQSIAYLSGKSPSFAEGHWCLGLPLYVHPDIHSRSGNQLSNMVFGY